MATPERAVARPRARHGAAGQRLLRQRGTASRRDLAAEDGTGPVSTVVGVAIFLVFLLFAAQVLIHLYATSVVSAAAFDAARLVAAQGGIDRAVGERHARQLLGRYGRRGDVRLDWSASTPDEVVLRITGPTPARLVDAVASLAGLDRIDRVTRVRVERFQTGP